jgi:hypothetical protein
VQPAASGFPDDQRIAIALLELIGFECTNRCFDVLWAAPGLRAIRDVPRCAHFVHDGLGHILVAFRELIEDGLQQVNSLLTRRLRVAFEGPPGRSDGLVDVRRRAEADASADFLRSRVDHV